MEDQTKEIEAKLAREQKVLDGAKKMLQVAADQTRQMCLIQIQDAQSRIAYLEGELKKLSASQDEVSTPGTSDSLPQGPQRSATVSFNIPPLPTTNRASVLGKGGVMGLFDKLTFKQAPQGPGTGNASKTGSTLSLSCPESEFPVPSLNFEFQRFGNTITSEQIQFRLKNVKAKLDLEKKVKAGTENLLTALSKLPPDALKGSKDDKTRPGLEEKIAEANFKVAMLTKAEHKYLELYVQSSSPKQEDDSLYLSDNQDRRTGRIIMRLVGAINISNRKSLKDEIFAVIKVDGSTKYTTKASKNRWDENINFQVDRAMELEIIIKEKSGIMLATTWFRLVDLSDYLEKKYGKNRSDVELEEIWLDLEPSGQLSFKVDFVGMNKSATVKDRVFRRDAVQKIYPRNGHRFVAQQFYQVMQCAVCNEFLGRADYHCQTCRYTVHAKCYNRVITKCVDCNGSTYNLLSKEEQNTGQLLKYNIPHRWEQATNIGAHWCAHCGHMVPPGRKIHRCSECHKVSHRECSPMIPHFCGLLPAVADQLVAAFEEHEKRQHAKELEEAENARKIQEGSEGGLDGDRQFTLTKNNVNSILEQVFMKDPARMGTLKRAPTVKKAAIDPKNISLDDFSLHSVLGRGAFGKVMLVSEKVTGSYFAMKALKKEFIIKNDDVGSTKLEKSIFQIASASKHPFLVNLHSCFQSDTRIYFVMEYVPGGDLMTHIQEKRRFSQIRTKFYACEVLLALEYLHMNKIMYRDLKLDNILLGADGHVKVADYGICKSNMSYGDLTATFCGTPDYMAVEVLLNKKYGMAVDWWSFGILIYVMLVGKYPYHGEDENEILDAILSDAIEFPPGMPPTTLSLIQGLLNKNPARRLGGGIADAEEVRRHAYFNGVDWNAILQKSVQPPHVPTINDPEDVSNFDKTFTTEDPVLTPVNSQLSEVEQGEFKDFTFVSEWAVQSRLSA